MSATDEVARGLPTNIPALLYLVWWFILYIVVMLENIPREKREFQNDNISQFFFFNSEGKSFMII